MNILVRHPKSSTPAGPVTLQERVVGNDILVDYTNGKGVTRTYRVFEEADTAFIWVNRPLSDKTMATINARAAKAVANVSTLAPVSA